MFIEDATLVAGISATAGIIIKGIDLLYNYIKAKTTTEECSPELSGLIHNNEKILEIITKLDADGTPLCYFPRRLVHQQEEYNQLLRNLTHNSDIMSKTLDKLTNTLENMVRVLDRLEDRGSRQ